MFWIIFIILICTVLFLILANNPIIKNKGWNRQDTDLTKLEKLLEARNWKKANEETIRLIYIVSGAINNISRQYLTSRFYFNSLEHTKKIDKTFLKKIDELWLKSSQGKFGFSVQKEVLDEIANQGFSLISFHAQKELGWRKPYPHELGLLPSDWSDDQIIEYYSRLPDGQRPAKLCHLNYNDLNFSDSAPRGHLPVIIFSVPIVDSMNNPCKSPKDVPNGQFINVSFSPEYQPYPDRGDTQLGMISLDIAIHLKGRISSS